jgi:hypothetical protein
MSWISSATALYASAGQAEAWWQRVVTPRYGSI